MALVACDNAWLADSVRSLLLETAKFAWVEVCTVAKSVETAAKTKPYVIVILYGSSFSAHRLLLERLRAEQPAARIVATIPQARSLYEAHLLDLGFDALVEENQLVQQLIPVIQQLMT